MFIFAILDKKTGTYMPFIAPSIFSAKESLTIDLQSEDCFLSKNSSDYDLYRLGSIDLNSGSLFQCVHQHDFICNISSLKKYNNVSADDFPASQEVLE